MLEMLLQFTLLRLISGNQGKPGDQAEEEEQQWQVAASQEPFEDTQERYAWY